MSADGKPNPNPPLALLAFWRLIPESFRMQRHDLPLAILATSQKAFWVLGETEPRLRLRRVTRLQKTKDPRAGR